jgi:hypothetical protein
MRIVGGVSQPQSFLLQEYGQISSARNVATSAVVERSLLQDTQGWDLIAVRALFQYSLASCL